MVFKDVGDNIIVVDSISKTFPGEVKALVDFSTKIHRGEVVVIIGPSGSGKSTFLRCLNGLEEIGSGSIEIDGIPLDLASKLLPLSTKFKFSILAHIHAHAKAQQRYGKVDEKTISSKMSRKATEGYLDNLENSIKKMK